MRGVRFSHLFLFSAGPLLVSEIMFRPLEGSSEWVELVNAGSRPVSLAGWSLRDARGAPSPLASGSGMLWPGEYVVVAEDPAGLRREFDLDAGSRVVGLAGSWPRLNNADDPSTGYADCVVLDGPEGNSDSACYRAEWSPEAGRSLERCDLQRASCDPLAWVASPANGGPTPGRGVAAGAGEIPERLSLDPNPFDPAMGPQLICLDVGEARRARGRAFVFNLAGELVRRLWDGEFGTGRACVAWHGEDDAGAALPSGAYVVLFEAGSWEAGVTWRARGRAVLDRGGGECP